MGDDAFDGVAADVAGRPLQHSNSHGVTVGGGPIGLCLVLVAEPAVLELLRRAVGVELEERPVEDLCLRAVVGERNAVALRLVERADDVDPVLAAGLGEG